jgi:hypothetical protein
VVRENVFVSRCRRHWERTIQFESASDRITFKAPAGPKAHFGKNGLICYRQMGCFDISNQIWKRVLNKEM